MDVPIRLPIRPQLLHAVPATHIVHDIEGTQTESQTRSKGGTKIDDTTEPAPHPDERQVRLDTDRSFVLYPVGETCSPLPCPRRAHGAMFPAQV